MVYTPKILMHIWSIVIKPLSLIILFHFVNSNKKKNLMLTLRCLCLIKPQNNVRNNFNFLKMMLQLYAYFWQIKI